MPAAKEAQNPSETRSKWRRRRIAKPPLTMTASASASHADMGPHQTSSGAARVRPSARKQMTSPMLDGLKTCSPRQRMTYLERSEMAAVPTKIHQPRRLHQSPCAVPGTRRTKATPLPVSIALAGQRMTCWLRNAIAISSSAQVPSARRICAIETSKWKPTCPITCSDARSTRELAEKVRDDAVERASFDPFFTFFLGGLAVFEDERRVGAVGVSGLPGADDERLAQAAIDATA